MLEHVRQGGNPYDARGAHIKELVQEMAVLSRFNRASQNKMFEGTTAQLVESARTYYAQLQDNLRHLSTQRGYQQYFESWTPADVGSETQLVENIKQLFVEQTIDARIEAAVPILARLQQGEKMKEVAVFENWINHLSEGTWALPDTPEAQEKLNKLMSQELIVGPDATNATENLYDVVGDDELFDILSDLAQRDPRANIWDDSDVQARLAELGIQTPQSTEAEPADVSQDTAPGQQGVAESSELGMILRHAGVPVKESVLTDSTGHTLDHILQRFSREVADFKAGGELDRDLFDALYDYYFDDMPYGIKKARTGDPEEWITDRLDQELGTGNHAARLPEADPMDTFEMGVMGPAMGGQMVGVGEAKSCNMTAEGEYCPEHGIAECGMSEQNVPIPSSSTAAIVKGSTQAATQGMGATRPSTANMPLSELEAVNEAPNDPINSNSAITGSYYESALARIKKLALGK
jgi:hypothetical protein